MQINSLRDDTAKPKPLPHRSVGDYWIVIGAVLISVYLVIGLISIMVVDVSSQTKVLGSADSINASQIISLTNNLRIKQGLNPLTPNPLLEEAARKKAQHMIDEGYWSHYSQTSNASPWDFIDATGYRYLHAGENLARGFTDSSVLINAWVKSESHRANLLNPNYQEIGVAVVRFQTESTSQALVVQLFATPMPATLTGSTISNQYSTPILVPKQIIPVFYPVIAVLTAVGLALGVLLHLWQSHQSTATNRKYRPPAALWHS